MVKCMRVYTDKEHIVVPYNPGNHWVTLIINVRSKQVFYLDLIINVRSKQVFYLDSSIPSDESGAPQIRDYSLVISILDE
jgi:Ulp1 family protease